MPRLWTETIEGHRLEVRRAILDTTEVLVGRHGPLSVTMSQIAEGAGIGRATLYKYFADVESILVAWHQRQIAAHLEQLAAIVARDEPAVRRLEAVLEAYARLAHAPHGHQHADLSAYLHRDDQRTGARRHLSSMLAQLIAVGAGEGTLRGDLAPAELAAYCIHATAAARELRSRAAVHRLVTVIMDGLRPPGPEAVPTPAVGAPPR